MTAVWAAIRSSLAMALALLVTQGAGGPSAWAVPPANESGVVGRQSPVQPLAPTELEDGRYFGPELDWSGADAAGYVDQTGVTPSFFSRPFSYPLQEALVRDLRDTALQAATLGSAVVVTLEPSKPLAELTENDATDLAGVLELAGEEYGTAFFVRFAPEMNGTWYEWGQQPEDYVSAFQTVASAVHAGAPSAAMLWAPSYAAGYPFTEAYGALEGSEDAKIQALDTNGNGLVETGDDPYRPYYPGDDAVDWVGLSMYHYGSYEPGAVADIDDPREYSGAIITSVLPEQDKFRRQLEGTYGMPPGAPTIDFAKEYGAERGQRFFVQTAALYDPADPDSAEETDIKTAWLEQLFDPAIAEEYPEIGMISWLELVRPEPEAEGRTVDWRLGAEEATSAALRQTLQEAPDVLLAPVVDQYVQEEASETAAEVSNQGMGTTIVVWVSAAAVALVVLWLIAMAVRPARRRQD